MTVKDLISELLECDMSKEISVEYWNGRGYEEAAKIKVSEYSWGVNIEV